MVVSYGLYQILVLLIFPTVFFCFSFIDVFFYLYYFLLLLHFSSVAQLCLTLCDPMNCSTPGLPVHQQLLKIAQTYVHRIRDAIQPSHPLSSHSPPSLNPAQNQGLFK